MSLSSIPPVSARERKPSVSGTPHYITQGLTLHTVSTPDEVNPAPSTGGGLGSYFSLSRNPSSGGSNRPLSRRPSLSSSTSAPSSDASSTFSLKLSHPRTPAGAPKMFARTNTGTIPPPTAVPQPPTSPNGLYTTLHETCTKRIATLDYLRRAHEGRVYFFNVMLTPRSDLQKLVYPDVKKLQKKAINFFTLGNSIPSILEVGANNPLDYLKAFNAVLMEYETYISHSPSRQQTTRAHSSSISLSTATTSSTSTLRNMSLPKFFRYHTPKPRRGSTATGAPDLSLERTRSSSGSGDTPTMNISAPTLSNEDSLTALPSLPLPSSTEEYTYLLTLPLPFDLDYFEVFATLCDVLIDVYSRVLTLVNSSAMCPPAVGDQFLKADQRIRRIVVVGTVKEWEEAVRAGVRREVGGVGREVLGGML
ncbi:hypothetical protein BDD12DRAFT_828824 [Trichophaea hybrida]|nr:hypothetical protein BDD12DRAFT_828824 [Trichophaea hybrida]